MPEAASGRPAGICVPYRGVTAAQAVDAGTAAAHAGYDSIWVSELAGYDAVAVAAAISARAPDVRVGTAVVPSTTRSPALLAMAAATLASLAPGRAVLGLGASTPTIVAGWHGGDAGRPLATMRDVLEILAAAFAGEPTDYRGERLSTRGFRLDAPPPERPRWYLGALGPKMRALAADRADGTILNFVPRTALEQLVAEARAGSAPDHEVVLMVRAGGDDADTEWRLRRELASYLGVDGYARFFEQHGYHDVVASITGKPTLDAKARALPDALVHDVAILARSSDASRSLEQVRVAGATPLIVPVCRPGDAASFGAVAQALAPSAGPQRSRHSDPIAR